MSGRKFVIVWSCVVLGALSIASLEAQKKGSNPQTSSLIPVSAEFRCPLAADCASAERVDRISGDGLGAYVGNSGAQQGPYLNSNNHLYFGFTSSYGRSVTLDFGDLADAASCAAAGTCRKNFAFVRTFTSDPPSITNPVDASGAAVPDGFYGIAVGESARSRFKFNFPDPAGRSLLWTIRFNSEIYPGSTDLTVSRLAENVWEVEASLDDIAELVAVPTKGKSVMTHEGFYTMPFKITVTR